MSDNRHITVLGQTNFRNQHRPFGIYDDDRRRHTYVIGKTGVGKTTLLENMIIQDIEAGKGVGLVDPHGDIAERLLDAIPPERTNDVIYFDPADTEWPIAFNVLEAVDPEFKYLVASGLVSSLKKIWADSWGPRLEYILRNTLLALLDYPSSTMLGITRMLADKSYRKKVVNEITDPVVKSFWVNEFANYNERFRSEAISPIQNKVGQFLSSAVIRNIVAQPKSTINMKDVMDNGKILIMNVSKGRIGEDNSALLGAMLITKIQLAAMDRAKIPEEQRRDFYLYVDEFQNFATESFASILSEARKYRLNLTIAHQYIAQMEEEVRDAVFGNVGTMITFRVGAFDAEYMESEYAPYFSQTDLVNLDKFHAYIKLMIDGVTSAPFSMRTIAPSGQTYESRDKVIKVSRERYAKKREVVEDKIARWSGVVHEETANNEAKGAGGEQKKKSPQPSASPDKANTELQDVVIRPEQTDEISDLASVLRGDNTAHGNEDAQSNKPRKSYPAVCDRCNKDTDLPFKPDPEKPKYCKACYEIVKQERKKESTQHTAPAQAPASSEEKKGAHRQQPQTRSRDVPVFRGPQPPE